MRTPLTRPLSGAAPTSLAPLLRVVQEPRAMLLLLVLLPMLTACKCGERKAASAALQSKPAALQSHAEPEPGVVTPTSAGTHAKPVQEAEQVDAIVAAVDAMIQDARSAQPSVAVSARTDARDAATDGDHDVSDQHRDVSGELDALLRDLNALEESLSEDHARNARLLREFGEGEATRATDRRRVRMRSLPSRSQGSPSRSQGSPSRSQGSPSRSQGSKEKK